MKDMVKERLLLLATAQECMIGVTDKMEQWEKSQKVTENNAFEAMNAMDKVLNMSREGERLIQKLGETCKEGKSSMDSAEYIKLMSCIEELQNLFQSINETSTVTNDLSHHIEEEVTKQKDLEEEIKKSLHSVGESIDSAVACAEFMLAEL